MWDELGIAPCDDPKAIRRAYAARLKKLDPDRDPQAFARLRGALEQALQQAGRNGGERALTERADRMEAADDADASAQDELCVVEKAHAHDRGEARTYASTGSGAGTQAPLSPALDQDDIRDRALLIALDAALARRDAAEATALYYRAAATGALSLAKAPYVIECLIAVAVDDMRFGAQAFRHLIRAVGLDASRARAFIDPDLRRRVMARLAADDWYDNLVATTERQKGRAARNRRRIARLILGRIGRFWHPRVDREALKSWLTQYHTHAAWLGGRIDPGWIAKLEGRVRRRQTFWLVFYSFFIGWILLQFAWVSTAALFYGTEDVWALAVSPFLVAFLIWVFRLLVKELLKNTVGTGGLSRLRDRGRTLWRRLARQS